MANRFSFLLHYGTLILFKRMFADGFREVACTTSNRYVRGVRMAALLAFYRSVADGDPAEPMDFPQIATWQVKKEKNARGSEEVDYAPPYEERYSEIAFKQFLARAGLQMGARVLLADVIVKWDTPNLEEEREGEGDSDYDVSADSMRCLRA